jgi:hypothetical protein
VVSGAFLSSGDSLSWRAAVARLSQFALTACGLISIAREKKRSPSRSCIPPLSESEDVVGSEEDWSATDAPKASGKPLGNVALPGILV